MCAVLCSCLHIHDLVAFAYAVPFANAQFYSKVKNNPYIRHKRDTVKVTVNDCVRQNKA